MVAAASPLAGLPTLPPLQCPLPELISSHRGPTKRSNWVVPGFLLAGDRSSLDNDAGLRAILGIGVTTIVCLQSRQETKSAVDYKKRARAIRGNVQFHEQPIPDQEIVDDEIALTLVNALLERLEQGEVLYVHCRGGHGRTGTVSALLLGHLYAGLSATEAMTRVQLCHDTRVQPVFASEGYEDLVDSEGCAVFFRPQREQVQRLLADAASSSSMPPPALDLQRASSAVYGPGASAYDERVMTRWLAAGKEARAAQQRARESKADKEVRRKELLAAAEAYREAKDLRPDYVRGYVGLARALRLAGETCQALEVLHQAHGQWPDDGAVLEELRHIPEAFEKDQVAEAVPAQPAPAANPPPTWRPLVQKPKLVILVGLPGCGKSTFSEQLVKSGNGWERICQDELGSRDSVENAIGMFAKDPQKRVLLDRCNELMADRKRFLSLAFNPQPAVCVHFDHSAADCEARVAARTDHPTIGFGKGRGAVRSKSRDFQIPSADEGFQEVITLSDFRDANHLLACWGAEVPEVRPAGFFKFPTTPHVLDLGATLTESDRLLSPDDARRFFDGSTTVHVEEKIDGANCGISLTKDYELQFQNRSHHVTSAYASQWKGLDDWKEQHAGTICMMLEPEVEILFGEWCLARHSVPYTDLPAYFIAFDIYNKREGKFCSVRERNRRLEGSEIPIVPAIAERAFASSDELMQLLQQPSSYYTGAMEGIYLRIDDPDDRGGRWLERRGKIVQPGFLQTIEDDGHWIHKDLVKNGLNFG
eukprot:gnl/TRDRNA2_/TRDRNA2_159640_c1_seq1.p1 gnl/TRDRNA2_/TRDRNA2_159640_c1~~gnl/TRDRNA2_/TRDRNA2_159640_c1_seq1.p1  ORF type:complete len:786 (+),score=169.28 gnl/TRDRNA2_/TRDRNA2_159640_c1_seq1:70-2358(+)